MAQPRPSGLLTVPLPSAWLPGPSPDFTVAVTARVKLLGLTLRIHPHSPPLLRTTLLSHLSTQSHLWALGHDAAAPHCPLSLPSRKLPSISTLSGPPGLELHPIIPQAWRITGRMRSPGMGTRTTGTNQTSPCPQGPPASLAGVGRIRSHSNMGRLGLRPLEAWGLRDP